MAQTRPATEAESTAEQTTAPSVTYRTAQAAEYGQWIASEDIYVGVALAYRKGDPVPASNVTLHRYDEAGLVEKVS